MGKILIIKGADFSKVAIGTHTIPPTPTGNLWDEALKDTDIAPLMANSTKVYELASAISNDGTKINADVNAAYQIMRKVFSNAMNEIVGVHLHPVIINL